MKKILITCGPTNEYIDEVMKITNMSTGRLGVELSRELSSRGHEITLICTRSVARGGLYERYGIANNPNVRTVQIETTEQMYNALEAEKNTQYDLVVHAAAVGDYKPEFSFRMEDMAEEILDFTWDIFNNNFLNKIENIFDILEEDFYGNKHIYDSCRKEFKDGLLSILTNPKCKVDDDTKISSYEPNLTVKLGLTPKLISHLREWFPNAVCVGFKLLENVSKEHIIEVATKLCNKNDMNYIIANDLHDLRQGKHISYLCNKDGYCNFDFHSPDDIANKIISFVDNVDNAIATADLVLEFDNKLSDDYLEEMVNLFHFETGCDSIYDAIAECFYNTMRKFHNDEDFAQIIIYSGEATLFQQMLDDIEDDRIREIAKYQAKKLLIDDGYGDDLSAYFDDEE